MLRGEGCVTHCSYTREDEYPESDRINKGAEHKMAADRAMPGETY